MKILELVEAALLIVAVIVLGIPEARAPAMRLALVFLLLAVTLPETWHAYRAGTLRMTLREIARSPGALPRASLLGVLATLTGSVALVV